MREKGQARENTDESGSARRMVDLGGLIYTHIEKNSKAGID